MATMLMMIMTKLVIAYLLLTLPCARHCAGISTPHFGRGEALPLCCKPTGKLCLSGCVEERPRGQIRLQIRGVSASSWNPGPHSSLQGEQGSCPWHGTPPKPLSNYPHTHTRAPSVIILTNALKENKLCKTAL